MGSNFKDVECKGVTWIAKTDRPRVGVQALLQALRTLGSVAVIEVASRKLLKKRV